MEKRLNVNAELRADTPKGTTPEEQPLPQNEKNQNKPQQDPQQPSKS